MTRDPAQRRHVNGLALLVVGAPTHASAIRSAPAPVSPTATLRGDSLTQSDRIALEHSSPDRPSPRAASLGGSSGTGSAPRHDRLASAQGAHGPGGRRGVPGRVTGAAVTPAHADAVACWVSSALDPGRTRPGSDARPRADP